MGSNILPAVEPSSWQIAHQPTDEAQGPSAKPNSGGWASSSSFLSSPPNFREKANPTSSEAGFQARNSPSITKPIWTATSYDQVLEFLKPWENSTNTDETAQTLDQVVALATTLQGQPSVASHLGFDGSVTDQLIAATASVSKLSDSPQSNTLGVSAVGDAFDAVKSMRRAQFQRAAFPLEYAHALLDREIASPDELTEEYFVKLLEDLSEASGEPRMDESEAQALLHGHPTELLAFVAAAENRFKDALKLHGLALSVGIDPTSLPDPSNLSPQATKARFYALRSAFGGEEVPSDWRAAPGVLSGEIKEFRSAMNGALFGKPRYELTKNFAEWRATRGVLTPQDIMALRPGAHKERVIKLLLLAKGAVESTPPNLDVYKQAVSGSNLPQNLKTTLYKFAAHPRFLQTMTRDLDPSQGSESNVGHLTRWTDEFGDSTALAEMTPVPLNGFVSNARSRVEDIHYALTERKKEDNLNSLAVQLLRYRPEELAYLTRVYGEVYETSFLQDVAKHTKNNEDFYDIFARVNGRESVNGVPSDVPEGAQKDAKQLYKLLHSKGVRGQAVRNLLRSWSAQRRQQAFSAYHVHSARQGRWQNFFDDVSEKTDNNGLTGEIMYFASRPYDEAGARALLVSRLESMDNDAQVVEFLKGVTQGVHARFEHLSDQFAERGHYDSGRWNPNNTNNAAALLELIKGYEARENLRTSTSIRDALVLNATSEQESTLASLAEYSVAAEHAQMFTDFEHENDERLDQMYWAMAKSGAAMAVGIGLSVWTFGGSIGAAGTYSAGALAIAAGTGGGFLTTLGVTGLEGVMTDHQPWSEFDVLAELRTHGITSATVVFTAGLGNVVSGTRYVASLMRSGRAVDKLKVVGVQGSTYVSVDQSANLLMTYLDGHWDRWARSASAETLGTVADTAWNLFLPRRMRWLNAFGDQAIGFAESYFASASEEELVQRLALRTGLAQSMRLVNAFSSDRVASQDLTREEWSAYGPEDGYRKLKLQGGTDLVAQPVGDSVGAGWIQAAYQRIEATAGRGFLLEPRGTFEQADGSLAMVYEMPNGARSVTLDPDIRWGDLDSNVRGQLEKRFNPILISALDAGEYRLNDIFDPRLLILDRKGTVRLLPPNDIAAMSDAAALLFSHSNDALVRSLQEDLHQLLYDFGDRIVLKLDVDRSYVEFHNTGRIEIGFVRHARPEQVAAMREEIEHVRHQLALERWVRINHPIQLSPQIHPAAKNLIVLLDEIQARISVSASMLGTEQTEAEINVLAAHLRTTLTGLTASPCRNEVLDLINAVKGVFPDAVRMADDPTSRLLDPVTVTRLENDYPELFDSNSFASLDIGTHWLEEEGVQTPSSFVPSGVYGRRNASSNGDPPSPTPIKPSDLNDFVSASSLKEVTVAFNAWVQSLVTWDVYDLKQVELVKKSLENALKPVIDDSAVKNALEGARAWRQLNLHPDANPERKFTLDTDEERLLWAQAINAGMSKEDAGLFIDGPWKEARGTTQRRMALTKLLADIKTAARNRERDAAVKTALENGDARELTFAEGSTLSLLGMTDKEKALLLYYNRDRGEKLDLNAKFFADTPVGPNMESWNEGFAIWWRSASDEQKDVALQNLVNDPPSGKKDWSEFYVAQDGDAKSQAYQQLQSEARCKVPLAKNQQVGLELPEGFEITLDQEQLSKFKSRLAQKFPILDESTAEIFSTWAITATPEDVNAVLGQIAGKLSFPVPAEGLGADSVINSSRGIVGRVSGATGGLEILRADAEARFGAERQQAAEAKQAARRRAEAEKQQALNQATSRMNTSIEQASLTKDYQQVVDNLMDQAGKTLRTANKTAGFGQVKAEFAQNYFAARHESGSKTTYQVPEARELAQRIAEVTETFGGSLKGFEPEGFKSILHRVAAMDAEQWAGLKSCLENIDQGFLSSSRPEAVVQMEGLLSQPTDATAAILADPELRVVLDDDVNATIGTWQAIFRVIANEDDSKTAVNRARRIARIVPLVRNGVIEPKAALDALEKDNPTQAVNDLIFNHLYERGFQGYMNAWTRELSLEQMGDLLTSKFLDGLGHLLYYAEQSDSMQTASVCRDAGDMIVALLKRGEAPNAVHDAVVNVTKGMRDARNDAEGEQHARAAAAGLQWLSAQGTPELSDLEKLGLGMAALAEEQSVDKLTFFSDKLEASTDLNSFFDTMDGIQ